MLYEYDDTADRETEYLYDQAHSAGSDVEGDKSDTKYNPEAEEESQTEEV